MTPAVAVHQLSFEYPGCRALREISFEIAPGTVTAVVGPNGAGKTTLFRCIAALEPPFSGSVSIFGHSTEFEPRECHQKIGYLSDFFGLHEELTIDQSLTYLGGLHGLKGEPLRRRINAVTESLALSRRLHEKVSDLSRGLRQRVGIAQSLLHEPKLLLLDEPAAGLDPEARAGLGDLIRQLQMEGITILVSSHILAELEDYSSHILVVDRGTIAGYSAIRDYAPIEKRLYRIALTIGASIDSSLFKGHPGISIISFNGGEMVIEFIDRELRPPTILRTLIQEGVPVEEFHAIVPNLQERYVRQLQKNRT
jgi:ABC-2 type transport system ATP-binding protein